MRYSQKTPAHDQPQQMLKNWIYIHKEKQTNSMALVRERTIPTERPPLVDEVIVNFCG
jgi:hypothetical protein